MNVATITMSIREARERWLRYAKAVRAHRNAEDESLRKAYRYLSQGRRVLSLHQVMSTAGRDHLHRPRLAIARCHWEECFFMYEGQEPVFSLYRSSTWSARASRGRRFVFRPETFGPVLHRDVRGDTCLRAVVPRVPIEFRPKQHLERYAVLWEAEWETVVRDPILLKPLGEDLYLVCAQWDLTDLERAILFHK